MKTPKIKEQIKWPAQRQIAQTSDIATEEFHHHSGARGFFAGTLQRTSREIDAADIPTVLCQIDAVGASPTAQVKRFPRRERLLSFNHLHQFRWTDTCIPGRASTQVGMPIKQTRNIKQ